MHCYMNLTSIQANNIAYHVIIWELGLLITHLATIFLQQRFSIAKIVANSPHIFSEDDNDDEFEVACGHSKPFEGHSGCHK